MKSNKGITLISLIIVIIIIVVIAGTTIVAGINLLNESRIVAFVTEMQVIQQKVNVFYESGDIADKGALVGFEGDLWDEMQRVASSIEPPIGATELKDFKYFNKAELKKIEVDSKQEVIINWETREVISITGVKDSDGKMKYRLEDIVGGTRNISGREITAMPTFSLRTEEFSDSLKIYLDNLSYGENINKGTVNYREKGETTWKEAAGTEIKVYDFGTYEVKVTNVVGISETKEIKVVYGGTANSPVVLSGMDPVIYDELEATKWKIIDPTVTKWYDYKAQQGTTDGRTSEWANVRLTDGSFFVWIPRYAYKITYYTDASKTTIAGYSDTRGIVQPNGTAYTGTLAYGDIDVIFLSGVNNKYVNKLGQEIDPTKDTNKYRYIVHPAFINDVDAGGWDKELKGFWVAKYEMSMENGSGTSIAVSNYTMGNVALGSNVKAVSKPRCSNLVMDKYRK